MQKSKCKIQNDNSKLKINKIQKPVIVSPEVSGGRSNLFK